MTKIWQIHDRYPESMIGEYDRTGPDRFKLLLGVRLGPEHGRWGFRFRGPISRLRKFDHLANNTNVPLVSRRFGDMLKQLAENDVELIPCEIEARDGTIQDYSLVNAVALVRVVDREQSQTVMIPGADAILKFNRLVLLVDCLGQHALARCAEYTSFLLVGDVLAEAISDAKMTGLRLTAPNQIHP